ncbi:hypothetical protein MD588_00845 [Photobacterium sp. SDRW27]|uniref:hypothetical protein n=1 Tax=Photobacterium obscurum TaxID=2829490 RepID=UPI002244E670|nr:hypothetical protein [Photobacterium obscurum]MCW8327348.1 hypothetical protein [Photobacterium obscurum]
MYQKIASDFQLLSLQERDKECLVSLFNDHKVNHSEQDTTCYVVFKQHQPYYYSLNKHRVEVSSISGSEVSDTTSILLSDVPNDSAVVEVEVEFPLALYRSVLRHDIFNVLLSLKEQCGHYTLNLRLPLNEIVSEYELNDIAKLCIVAGADNLTLVLDDAFNEQQNAYITLLSNLLKRFFVTDSCGLIYAGLTTLPAMERVVALSKDVLDEEWVEEAFLKFEC